MYHSFTSILTFQANRSQSFSPCCSLWWVLIFPLSSLSNSIFLPADSVDTPQAMRVMKELVNTSNIYLSDPSGPVNARLLHSIASYLTDMLRVFGVITGSTSSVGFPVAQASENLVSNTHNCT